MSSTGTYIRTNDSWQVWSWGCGVCGKRETIPLGDMPHSCKEPSKNQMELTIVILTEIAVSNNIKDLIKRPCC